MIKKEVRDKLYKAALDKWGRAPQLNMVFEEAGELILELLDMKDFSNVVEEIADLTIMMEQVIKIFDLESAILKYLEKKQLEEQKISNSEMIKKVAKLITGLSRFIRGRNDLIHLANDLGNTINYFNHFLAQNKLEDIVIILKNEKLLRLKERIEATDN